MYTYFLCKYNRALSRSLLYPSECWSVVIGYPTSQSSFIRTPTPIYSATLSSSPNPRPHLHTCTSIPWAIISIYIILWVCTQSCRLQPLSYYTIIHMLKNIIAVYLPRRACVWLLARVEKRFKTRPCALVSIRCKRRLARSCTVVIIVQANLLWCIISHNKYIVIFL